MTDKEYKYSIDREMEQLDYINKITKADKAIRVLDIILKVGFVIGIGFVSVAIGSLI